MSHMGGLATHSPAHTHVSICDFFHLNDLFIFAHCLAPNSSPNHTLRPRRGSSRSPQLLPTSLPLTQVVVAFCLALFGGVVVLGNCFWHLICTSFLTKHKVFHISHVSATQDESGREAGVGVDVAGQLPGMGKGHQRGPSLL